jgi:AcrR family transcriptional regulator
MNDRLSDTVDCIDNVSMDQPPAVVKAHRRYDSPRRQEQARKTREDVLVAAERLLLRDGFGATTIAAVAAAASVSVETVYKGFGGKPGLVQALCERALAGEGPIPAETRSDDLQHTESDPYVIIRGWGRLAAEVSPRISPIMLLVRAASGLDPEVGRLRADLDARRLERMTRNAASLAAADHLRPDVTIEDASAVLWLYSSAELFELLVLIRGWTVARYGDFIAEAMIAALLPPATSTRNPLRHEADANTY